MGNLRETLTGKEKNCLGFESGPVRKGRTRALGGILREKNNVTLGTDLSFLETGNFNLVGLVKCGGGFVKRRALVKKLLKESQKCPRGKNTGFWGT